MPEKPTQVIDLQEHIPALCLSLGGKIALHAKRHSARQLNLDLCEWRLIQVLGAQGQCTIFDIADWISMDKGGTSRAVSRLEQSGYLRREADADDRRRSLVRLTDAGWKLHDAIVRFAAAREERLMKKLSPDDRRQLRNLLNRLVSEANQMIEEQWTPQSSVD